MHSFRKSAKRLRSISALSEIGGISGGFLTVWLAAEPITGTVAVAGGIAISQLVKRIAEDREKRGNDQNMRISNDAQETFQAELMGEIQSVKNSLNYIVLSLAALVIAYSLRSISFSEWQSYLIGSIAVILFFYLFPAWRGNNNSIENKESDIIKGGQHSQDKKIEKKRKWWRIWGESS
ncbi:hypothetical protein [Marinobacter salarius]|uniref:hypothetical protein n=1 Tax=Marinobacter salarius TaxID=1420917 RepID=UPI0018F20087|nr:hypothetical protein [Marinobacter salarius]MBJ7299066.1 hypothetical protein [Marinobacter salarius]HIO31835.1 hypothetical protein [Marinobacter salarius]HIO99730.1 hypothetical protein [Marinobacter salarius]